MNALIMNCSPVRSGATAAIVETAADCLKERYDVRAVCIDDFSIAYCKGCRTCHHTAKCVQHDDVEKVMALYEWADVILSVAPSYWADVPGQFKSFIDRCTPWSSTHEPHASIGAGKRGYAVALRTGAGMKECGRIIESLEHFYGHLEIERCGSLGLCSVENREAALRRRSEIIQFCGGI